MAALPTDGRVTRMKWDGEWHITYEVFRDLGLAFAVVLILIYMLVVGWFQSFLTPLDHHGGDSVLAGRHHAGARSAARVLYRDVDDRLHRRRRHRGAQLHHPGDFIELRLKEGMPLDRGRDRCRSGSLPPHDARPRRR